MVHRGGFRNLNGNVDYFFAVLSGRILQYTIAETLGAVTDPRAGGRVGLGIGWDGVGRDGVFGINVPFQR